MSIQFGLQYQVCERFDKPEVFFGKAKISFIVLYMPVAELCRVTGVTGVCGLYIAAFCCWWLGSKHGAVPYILRSSWMGGRQAPKKDSGKLRRVHA